MACRPKPGDDCSLEKTIPKRYRISLFSIRNPEMRVNEDVTIARAALRKPKFGRSYPLQSSINLPKAVVREASISTMWSFISLRNERVSPFEPVLIVTKKRGLRTSRNEMCCSNTSVVAGSEPPCLTVVIESVEGLEDAGPVQPHTSPEKDRSEGTRENNCINSQSAVSLVESVLKSRFRYRKVIPAVAKRTKMLEKKRTRICTSKPRHWRGAPIVLWNSDPSRRRFVAGGEDVRDWQILV